MSIVRAQVTTLEQLAAWMQEHAVPNIFKSVEIANNIITATDNDDNTVLEIRGAKDGSDYFRAYRTTTGYLQIASRAFFNDTMNIIGCDNGFLLDGNISDSNGYGRIWAALITKTNNDKVAVVFPSSVDGSAARKYYQNLQHVAFGDSPTMATTTTFTPEAAQQTTLCPFGTNADVGTASYTTDAYYMPMGQNYNSGIAQFSIGNDHFITNGFWAIRTGGDE